MRNLLATLGILVLSTASALAAPAPKGMGNFRRAEAIRAVGANPAKAYVTGVTTSANRVTGIKLPKNSRVLIVEHGTKVDLVRAPLDKSQPVHQMGKAEAERMGLVTQATARKYASQNRGVYGTGKVKVEDAGFGAKRGSYLFKQTSPKSHKINFSWGKYKATNIVRSVSVHGQGESATGTLTNLDR